MAINDFDNKAVISRQNTYTTDGRDITLGGNPLLNDYYKNEQSSNDLIVNHTIGMCWAGIGIIVFAVFLSIFKGIDVGVITLVSGGVVDVISGTILVLAKHSLKSKDKYFKTLSATDERSRMMEFINSIEDSKTRSSAQRDFVKKYMETIPSKQG